MIRRVSGSPFTSLAGRAMDRSELGKPDTVCKTTCGGTLGASASQPELMATTLLKPGATVAPAELVTEPSLASQTAS